MHAVLGGSFLEPLPGVTLTPPLRHRASLVAAGTSSRTTTSTRGAGARSGSPPRPSWPTHATLVEHYFLLEDPNGAQAVGIELGVETVVDGMRLRGVIDRLDVARRRRPDRRRLQDGAGSLRAIRARQLGRRPDLCAVVREPARACPGRSPAPVPTSTESPFRRCHPSRPSVASAVGLWRSRSAIERACDAEDFRPHVSPLCNHCHFKSSCPAFAV